MEKRYYRMTRWVEEKVLGAVPPRKGVPGTGRTLVQIRYRPWSRVVSRSDGTLRSSGRTLDLQPVDYEGAKCLPSWFRDSVPLPTLPVVLRDGLHLPPPHLSGNSILASLKPTFSVLWIVYTNLVSCLTKEWLVRTGYLGFATVAPGLVTVEGR